MTKTDICTSCVAHRGFWNSWTDARDRVLPAVAQAVAANPSYQLRVTGHSLGGAIATLAAASMRNTGHAVALYTFGSPRVGGSKISDYITKQAGGNYRVTHWNDPVPKLPLLTMGYVHTSPEYYINKPNGQDVLVGDVYMYEGAISFRGNGRWLAIDADAHMWYFSTVSACDANKGKRRAVDIIGANVDMDVITMF
jgi:acetyl esterase/lipase